MLQLFSCFRCKWPDYVQGYQPGTITAKCYVDVDKGYKSAAENFFHEKCPELMAEGFIYVGEQEGRFSLIMKSDLGAGTFKNAALSFSSIQHGSPLVAITTEDFKQVLSNKNIKKIADIPSAEIAGSLSSFLIDRNTGKLYVLSGWHPLKGQLFDDKIKVTPGSTPKSGELDFPVVTESKVGDQTNVHHVGSHLYGGFSLVKDENDAPKAVDVAVLEATDEFKQIEAVKFLHKIRDEDIALNVYHGADHAMLKKFVEKTGTRTQTTRGHIIAVNRSVRIGDSMCGGCFLVRQYHHKMTEFATYSDSGALVMDALDDRQLKTLNKKVLMGYGLCHSVHHKYKFHETGEEIDTTLCVRLDYCLQFLREKCHLDLNFLTPQDLSAIFKKLIIYDSGFQSPSSSGNWLEYKLI